MPPNDSNPIGRDADENANASGPAGSLSRRRSLFAKLFVRRSGRLYQQTPTVPGSRRRPTLLATVRITRGHVAIAGVISSRRHAR